MAPEPLLSQIKAVDLKKHIKDIGRRGCTIRVSKKFIVGEQVKTKLNNKFKYYHIGSWGTPGGSGYYLMRDDGKLCSAVTVRKLCEEL